MNKLHQKIMSANFAKALKRWMILAVCVVLLGGGASAALLRVQIGEGMTEISALHENREEHSRMDLDGGDARGEERGRGEEHDDNAAGDLSITKPSGTALIAVGVTALLCGFLGIAFWLLTAAWLYRAAVLSGMSGPLWGILGLGGSLFAAALFLIVRSFIREKCPGCGAWQDRSAAYCGACGGAMRQKCPACGAARIAGARFCSACGRQLEQDDGSEGSGEGRTC